MQIRVSAETWFEARSTPGRGPRAWARLHLEMEGDRQRRQDGGETWMNPVTQGSTPPQLPRKLPAVPSERQEGGRGPHLIHDRLSSSCLSTPPPPQSSLAREQDGSYPQEIKIPNGSICQALGPATKADSVPVKSPQVGGLQPPLCVSSEVSLLNSRGQQDRFLRPLPTPANHLEASTAQVCF